MLPSEDGDGYRLKAFVACFPAGFDTKEKFGLKVRDIHGPVPGYKNKLERSMDRFFERLEIGRVVRRANVCFLRSFSILVPQRGFKLMNLSSGP